jgi:hypothetical protein
VRLTAFSIQNRRPLGCLSSVYPTAQGIAECARVETPTARMLWWRGYDKLFRRAL